MNWPLKIKMCDMFGSQADFAQALDIGDAYVSRAIHGRIVLSNQKKIEWAKMLKCNVKDIFK